MFCSSTCPPLPVHPLKLRLQDISLSETHVIHCDPDSLHLQLPDELDFPESDSVIPTLFLHIAGQLIELQQLHVGNIDITQRKIQLINHNPQNKPYLWQLIYELHTRSTSADTVNTSVRLPIRHLYTYTEQARQKRLNFLSQHRQIALSGIANTSLHAEQMSNTIEGFIGSIEIPVGIGGPLLIHGDYAQGTFYAPLATTEGALVASVSRGSMAITTSGGVTTKVIGQRMMRVPVFTLESIKQASFFANWLTDHMTELQTEIRKHSNFAQLTGLNPIILGRDVHVYFIYRTGDASGQNMTTICTWHACQWILQQLVIFPDLKLANFLIDGTHSSDKKVSYQSFINGRGTHVIAEACIHRNVCRQILNVTPEQIMQTYRYAVEGAITTGMIGINVNTANIIAALYTALGQDIACVHESAISHLHCSITEQGDLYTSIVLPSLVIGTVGGGTQLPQQRECLSILGCEGSGNVYKLAEIIAGYCLALELSTASAITSNHFANAHERLGRNRPSSTHSVGLQTLNELDHHFFNQLTRCPIWDNTQITAATPLITERKSSGILTTLTAQKFDRLIGLYPFQLQTNHSSQTVMVKIKATDQEVIGMMKNFSAQYHPPLGELLETFSQQLEFRGCHERELAIMSCQHPQLMRYMPQVYATLTDKQRCTFLLVEEYLADLELIDSIHDTSVWQPEHFTAAITGIAEVHGSWFNRETELLQQFPQLYPPTQHDVTAMIPLWHSLNDFVHHLFSNWLSDESLHTTRKLIDSIGQWWHELAQLPKTLIHNDFNPRNIAFRRHGQTVQLCAYDWELATVHIPQRDLAELLVFTLPPTVEKTTVDHYIELHRQTLQQYTTQPLCPQQWRRGYLLALYDLMIRRFSFYLAAHSFSDYAYIERTVQTLQRLLSLEKDPSL